MYDYYTILYVNLEYQQYLVGLLSNGCIQTAIGFFQTTQTTVVRPWRCSNWQRFVGRDLGGSPQCSGAMTALRRAMDEASTKRMWSWSHVFRFCWLEFCCCPCCPCCPCCWFCCCLLLLLLLLLSEMERNIPQIALLNPVDSNLTRSFHNHP